MEKALVKIIFGCKFFIYQPIFKIFVLFFKAVGMQKDDEITFNYFLLDVFQNKVTCSIKDGVKRVVGISNLLHFPSTVGTMHK